MSLPDLSAVPSRLYPRVTGGVAPRLAASLLRAELATPYEWHTGGWGRDNTQNPEAFLSETLWQTWVRTSRGLRIRRHLDLTLGFQDRFWSGPEREPGDPDAYACLWVMVRTDLTLHLANPLLRLREASPSLAPFVFYALVDSLRRVVPVYDWRTAQAEFDARWGPREHAPLAQVLDRIEHDAPREHVPEWLRRRAKHDLPRMRELAESRRVDAWVRKTTAAAIALVEAASSVRRADLNRFPSHLGNLAGLVESPPALIVALTAMDPTDGMAREHLRQHSALGAKNRGPAKSLKVPAICLPLHCARPATLKGARTRVEAALRVLEAASDLLELLHKWWWRGGGRRWEPAQQQQVLIPVTVG